MSDVCWSLLFIIIGFIRLIMRNLIVTPKVNYNRTFKDLVYNVCVCVYSVCVCVYNPCPIVYV